MRSILLKLKPKSFKNQLTIGLLTLVTFAVVTFIYISTTKNSNFLKEEGITQALNRSLALATSSRTWMMSNDYLGAQEVVDSYAVYDDLVFATIINLDGQVIACTNHEHVGKFVSDKERIDFISMNAKTHAEYQILLNDGNSIDIIRYVSNDNYKHIGAVNLRIDQSQRQKIIKDIVIQNIWFAVITLLIIFAFVFMSIKNLIQRLMLLIQTMDKVRLGHRDVKADENDFTELSELAKEFNSMLNSLNKSEKSNKETKERLELAIKGSSDGLWDWNLLDDTIYYSIRWKEILGFTDDELPNEFSSWEDRVHPEDIGNALKDLQDHVDGKTEKYENIHRIKHKDGHWVWILDRAKCVFDEDGKAERMLGTFTDITKEKELQIQIQEQEEIMIAQSGHAAMGEMIGMIAHQWRQPITVIAMGANNMLIDIELEEVEVNNFKREALGILQQTEYLSKTIDDFRNFFRPNKEKDWMKIEDIMHETQMVIDKSLKNNNIKLTIKSDNTDPILSYSRELLQVFINLLKNAKEVLVEKIKENRHINVVIKNKEDSIVVTICDNGGGIDKEIITKIFDPYFSTKDKKTGTGLGLYMSKIIVEKHIHGTIRVENIDSGACFEVIIPKA